MTVTLWRALGRPRTTGPVPGADTPEWAFALLSLRRHAREEGIPLPPSLASWHDLWTLSRGSPCPSQPTWAQLCDGLFVEDAANGSPANQLGSKLDGASSTTPLWIALGRPPHDLSVQGRHSEEWRRAADSLRCHLVREGVSFAPPILRSWRRLWISCHGSQPPACTTWAKLCQGCTLSSLSPRPPSPDEATPFPLTSWNIRWLVDASSHAAQHKRSALRRHLHLGRVVCIQETHWAPWTAEQWKNLFPTSAVHWTPGTRTATGAFSGGTAVLVPHHFRSHGKELVPGCAVQAICTAPGQPPIRVVSLYLPKGAQGSVIRRLEASLDPFDGPTYLAGDFNLELLCPRGPEEAALVPRLKALFDRHGSILMPTGPTRWDNLKSSTIDGIAIPSSWARDAHVSQNFDRTVSDHACLVVAPQQSRRRARPCNPATIRTLPPEALIDLRRRFGQLELMFGLSSAPIPRAPPAGHPPCQVGELHPSNPASVLNPGAEPTGAQKAGAATSPRRTFIQEDARLARHGHQALCSMLESWWNLWKHKTPRDLVLDELQRAAFGSEAARPSDTLRHWMSGFVEDPPTSLSPDDARGWIATYLAARKPQQPAGPLTGRRRVSWKRPLPHDHHLLGRGLYRKTFALKGIKGPDGKWTDKPELVQDILWNSRAEIWASIHPHSDAGAPILSAYAKDRAAPLPPHPAPALEDIAGAILAAGDAAPGPDGWPYEIFHCGVNFTAHLIGQAILSTRGDTSWVDACLGPNVDLLIWSSGYPKRPMLTQSTGNGRYSSPTACDASTAPPSWPPLVPLSSPTSLSSRRLSEGAPAKGTFGGRTGTSPTSTLPLGDLLRRAPRAPSGKRFWAS